MDHLKQFELREISIDILNDDILERIFNYLHLDDKIRLRRTSIRWKFLLDRQLSRIKALRIGQFQQGGFNITSGLQTHCQEHSTIYHRQQTGTLFNKKLITFPAELETHCYSVDQYDYLHRSLKFSHKTITQLSLGRLNISYRLLMVLTNNLPNLEHLELISCASGLFESNNKTVNRSPQSSRRSNRDKNGLPSLASFNEQPAYPQQNNGDPIYSLMILYNQNSNEQVNMEERLLRSTLVKNCDLVRESKARNNWPNLRHLLVKECNLLNEFSLSLILAITSQTLVNLVVESNQYLTGEFLNYCGPQLKILRVKYCPLLQVRFLEDFVKLKKLLSPSNSSPSSSSQTETQSMSNKSYMNGTTQQGPQPINSSMIQNFRNLANQDIYCTL